ncbi:MAG: 2-isopropylmalate synthase, partial [Acidobacteria bacterium]|nr:2-isopropylmalate synthase [Acidobacteriota bacterium]
LRLTREEVLEHAVNAVRFAKSLAPEVEFSAEDASRSDYGYLREVVAAVHAAGATVVNIPDTVGYALPHEFGALVTRLLSDVPGVRLSVHNHDDLGLAVGNALAALLAGAHQVEVTVNGIGERAGNASLEELVMALHVRREALGLTTGIRTAELAPTSRLLSLTTGIWPQPNKAVVGRNAFAHEAGIHQHGMLSNPLTYEIMTPESVGATESHLVLGKHSGRHAVEARLKALGIPMSREDAETLTARVKELADRKKFVFDEDLVSLAGAGDAPPPAGLVRLLRFQAISGNHVLPTATVEVEVDGERRTASATGNGPLDAALKATDLALGLDVTLVEFATRAITSGKDALAEVVVKVRYGSSETTGHAASTDSIEAAVKSYLAAVSAARVAAHCEIAV